MASSARRRGPETRAPRQTRAGVERGTTNYINISDTTDSATSLRLQRLFGIGIIGNRADLIASLAWGGTR